MQRYLMRFTILLRYYPVILLVSVFIQWIAKKKRQPRHYFFSAQNIIRKAYKFALALTSPCLLSLS